MTALELFRGHGACQVFDDQFHANLRAPTNFIGSFSMAVGVRNLRAE